MDVKAEAELLTRELEALGAPERADKEKAYLKSALTHWGVGNPAMRNVAKAWKRANPEPDHDALVALVERLWSAPIYELRFLAMLLLELHPKRLVAGDIALLERLVRESKTWALVDNIATAIVGPLVVRSPALNATLDRWASDPDFWIRRSAMLALLVPLRKGGGDFERFARYADAMLEEKEFFIRKAIGWILRETARKRPDLVYAWLAPRAHRASGLTVREATKYLPEVQREELLAVQQKR